MPNGVFCGNPLGVQSLTHDVPLSKSSCIPYHIFYFSQLYPEFSSSIKMIPLKLSSLNAVETKFKGQRNDDLFLLIIYGK